MRTLHEPAREIPIVTEADVVVCGGGPGGVSAAIAAARHGAKTLLIERHGYLGGLATAGLVAPVLGHTASESHIPIVEGLLREITERLNAIDGAPSWEDSLLEWGIRFDAEALKYVLDQMCAEAGVQVLFHTQIADVFTADDRIEAVIIENKSGRQAVAGRIFVDGTGDADIAFRAGAPTTHGREWDGRGESMGSFFHLGGVPEVSAERTREITELIEHEMEDGRFAFYNSGFMGKNTHHRDHTSANMTRFAGDSARNADLTRGEAYVREQVWELVRLLRAHVPEMADIYVQQTSPQIGPRESRQIVGPYARTGDDIHQGARFDDAIARGSWWIDIHCPLGHTYPVHLCTVECPRGVNCPYWVAEHDHMRSKAELYPPKGGWYDIPYRALLSIRIANLLASGRCISATHEGMAGARVMGTCIAIGQAAGTAAALAVAADVSLQELDVQQLRRVLREDGQYV
mgnify:FL=1